MMGKIAVTLLWVVCFGAEFGGGGLAAATLDGGSYMAQAPEGPARTDQRPPAAAPPPARGKAAAEKGKESPSAAPSRSEPLKPFDPTEKVKADQAIDFPADI
jgi:hypothetical protein